MKKVGRPQIGVTKKVSITLSEDTWTFLQNVQYEQNFTSLSETLRFVIELTEKASDFENWPTPEPVVTREKMKQHGII